MPRRSLILLDRDGVLNEDSPDFIRSEAELLPIAGSLEAVARLSRAGHAIAVVTNQSGLGRGLFDRTTLEAIHDRLAAGVAAHGGRIDRFEVCPHLPEDGCRCRKPRAGLLEAAADRFGRAPADAILVGDRRSDLEAAQAFGCRAVLVRTGHGRDTERTLTTVRPDGIYDDLAAFVLDLLSGDAQP